MSFPVGSFITLTAIILLMGLVLVAVWDMASTKFTKIYCALLVIPLVAWLALGVPMLLRALMEVWGVGR